jgi:WD40 repeat protein
VQQSPATASRDRTARLWDVGSGRELATLQGHKEAVNLVIFSPDGHRVATASVDGALRLWPLFHTRDDLALAARARLPRCLSERQKMVFGIVDPVEGSADFHQMAAPCE